MSTVEFEEIRPVRPALQQPAQKQAQRALGRDVCDVAIIGAGPYGLSLAAQLAARGVSFRIFGKPLDTWRAHMPKDMLLKSEGFASSLSHPSPDSRLEAYCAARRIPYSDQDLPVSLDLFLEYAEWFRKTYVPTLEEKNIISLEKKGDGFELTLEDGERLFARRTVLAVGITWFSHLPPELCDLAPGAASHSYDHRDVSRFKGKEVTVLGSGASAIDLAALLHDSGASVRIVARDHAIRYHSPPQDGGLSLWQRIKSPASTIGPGWRSWIFVKFPYLFRYLPEALRLEIVRRHLGPAPGWFMRERVEGRIERLLGHRLDAARMMGNRVMLRLVDTRGNAKTIECDHVVAATGYKPDFARVPFMTPDLLKNIRATGGAPALSAKFETSVPGLYVVGPAAANSFGPLMRFMTGSEFVAPFVAKHLKRR